MQSMKNRIEELIDENHKSRKREKESRSLLEVKESEVERSRERESELQEQISILHDDILRLTAENNHLENLQSNAQETVENLESDMETFKEENRELQASKENLVKAVRAYEILLGEISKTVKKTSQVFIQTPRIDVAKVNKREEREAFMSQLCNFEEEIKACIIKGEQFPSSSNRQSRLGNEERDKEDRAISLYEEMINKLKGTVADCFEVLQDILSEPERVKELVDVIMEYYDARVELEKEGELLQQKEQSLENTQVG